MGRGPAVSGDAAVVVCSSDMVVAAFPTDNEGTGVPGARAPPNVCGAGELLVPHSVPVCHCYRDHARRSRPTTYAGQMVQRLVVVCGPTGCGKSDLAIDLAERWGGEVVNCDSMQLYRGMDIGTAKVPTAERRGIKHHLLDVLEVTETASVAAYQRDARAIIGDILRRGRVPVLAGGSALYLQAVIDPIEFPGTDPQIRARLTEELHSRGARHLWERLAEQDPAAAQAIDPRNDRRLVRALEVIELTGKPFTARLPKPGPPRYDAALICIDRDTPQLDQRLAERLDSMMDAGFLDEVRMLETLGLRDGLTASRALGYRQLLAALDETVTVPEAVIATVTATRRFVRRQRSWFRRDDRMTWLDAADPDLLQQAARVVENKYVG